MTFTHEWNPKTLEVAVVTREPRWWGRPLRWIADMLYDLAYVGATESRKVVDTLAEWESAPYTFERASASSSAYSEPKEDADDAP